MKASNYLLATRKEQSESTSVTSHDLSLRAGLVYQVTSGIFDYLPTGQRVIQKIEKIIRKEMDFSGALEISMPIVQPAEIWQESGRWDTYKGEMIKFKNREGRDFCLGPTNEETVSHLIKPFINSYRQLPLTVYQIGKKFRDELRPRHGLLRTRDFIMKDAYSFDTTTEGLDASYDKVRETYLKIFNKLELEVFPIPANSGEIGGSASEEFISSASIGEDKFFLRNQIPVKIENDNDCTFGEQVQTGIEVAHIFKLGNKYSLPMNLNFADRSGNQRPLLMGCYGIGVSRLITALIEQNHDEKGIIWPTAVSPFDLSLIPTSNKPEVLQQTEKIYLDLQNSGIDVFYDDRDVSTGTKFKDSNLIGIPQSLIIGPKGMQEGTLEIESRKTGQKKKIKLEEVLNHF